jgi:CheY-like chemotaxis protein
MAIILCDLRMPNMTGHEFLEEVSLDPSLKQTLVILLDTDWVMDQDAINAWSKPTPSGRTAFAHWIKPLNVAEYAAGTTRLLPRLDRTA